MKALLVIDMQKEWQDEHSEYFIGNITPLIQRINKLIAFARAQHYKIIFTKHNEEEGEAFRNETKNSGFVSPLDVQPQDTIITKYRISPFFKTSLEKDLSGIGVLIVCGVLTNLCVRSAVQDAYDRDFDIVIVEDCTQCEDDDIQDFTLRDLHATRPEITITQVDDYITS